MEIRKFTVDENQIHVVDAGAGPTILFAHGFPLDHTMWRFQIEALSERFRVLCPDLPGFGASRADSRSMSMRKFADQLAGLLDAMGVVTPVIYCGLSMGGYIGWQFWKHHPEKISHLIACDTRAANDTVQVARGRKISAANVRQTGSSPVADAMTEKLFYQPSNPAKQEITEQIHAVISQADPESIASGQLAMSQRPDSTPWLAEIKVPALFVAGAQDEITTPEEMRQNADLVPDSTFLEIPNAGHMSPLENPAAFNRGVIDFLNRHVPEIASNKDLHP
jgi:pimeloyl-ACP methyl ester carboxylesterase